MLSNDYEVLWHKTLPNGTVYGECRYHYPEGTVQADLYPDGDVLDFHKNAGRDEWHIGCGIPELHHEATYYPAAQELLDRPKGGPKLGKAKPSSSRPSLRNRAANLLISLAKKIAKPEHV